MKVWKIDDYNYFFNSIIKVTEEELKKALNEKKNYKKYDIPKKNGKRHIYVLQNGFKLKYIQKQLKENFLDNIMLADCCYGFRKGYNYFDFLENHIWFYQENFYLRLDIENFFDSIKFEELIDVLGYYIEESKELDKQQKNNIIKYILEIVTYNNKLVQGISTSPVISNIVFRQLDIRIEKYCRKLDIEYTRYADDLLFSSKNSRIHSKRFLKMIQKIIASKGFKINYSKIIRAKNEMTLNGFVVGKDIRISRRKFEDLVRVLFYLENTKYVSSNKKFIEELNKKLEEELGKNIMEFHAMNYLTNYLAGNRSFLIYMLKYSSNERTITKLKTIINRINKQLLRLV